MKKIIYTLTISVLFLASCKDEKANKNIEELQKQVKQLQQQDSALNKKIETEMDSLRKFVSERMRCKYLDTVDEFANALDDGDRNRVFAYLGRSKKLYLKVENSFDSNAKKNISVSVLDDIVSAWMNIINRIEINDRMSYYIQGQGELLSLTLKTMLWRERNKAIVRHLKAVVRQCKKQYC